MNKLTPASELFQRLAQAMRPCVSADTVLIGIHTGGVWIAERLHQLEHRDHPAVEVALATLEDAKGGPPRTPRVCSQSLMRSCVQNGNIHGALCCIF